MNLSDKVYYVEFHALLYKFEIIETTVGKAIKNFMYSKKKVFEEFEKKQDKSLFSLNTVFMNGFFRIIIFTLIETMLLKRC